VIWLIDCIYVFIDNDCEIAVFTCLNHGICIGNLVHFASVTMSVINCAPKSSPWLVLVISSNLSQFLKYFSLRERVWSWIIDADVMGQFDIAHFDRNSCQSTSIGHVLNLAGDDAKYWNVHDTLLFSRCLVELADWCYVALLCLCIRMRGLVLDIERGNFLKLAKDGTILK